MTSNRTKALGVIGAAVLAAAGVIGMHYEGKVNTTYADVGGVPTICFGHTHGVKAAQHATDAQCEAWLKDDMGDALAAVDRCMPNLPFNARVAFTDAAYNVGPSIVCGSTLQRKALAGDIVGACNELPRWVYAGGRVLQGLVKRRATEQSICLGASQ